MISSPVFVICSIVIVKNANILIDNTNAIYLMVCIGVPCCSSILSGSIVCIRFFFGCHFDAEKNFWLSFSSSS